MDPIQTLYDRIPAPAETLPPALAALYDGGLAFSAPAPDRPTVVANFVATLDGVVSFDLPGQRGGGSISGENEADHAIMGLLRASADAVIFGAGSLREDSGHVRTPAFISPAQAPAYAELRVAHGQAPLPLNVVVSASGEVDLRAPNFHHPGLRVLIATTPAGAARLAREILPPGVEARVVGSVGPEEHGVAPGPLLALLQREYGVRLALHEGGPRLFTAFLRAGCVDEVFLTLAPQLAGRSASAPRRALVEEYAYAPQTALWSELLSVKRAGAHLFLRYRVGAPRATTAAATTAPA